MTHYVCNGGCKGISDDSEVICQATDCLAYSKPLNQCNCEDGMHEEVNSSEENLSNSTNSLEV